MTPGQPAAANPIGLAKGIWDAYGPSVLGAIQKGAQSNGFATASGASVRSPGQEAEAGLSPRPEHTATPPAFPEPQVY